MKRIKFTVVLALMLSVSLVGMSAVQADTVTVTAQVGTPTGTRTLSPITAPAALVFAAGATTASAAFTVTAVEALANGVNSWSVTAVSSNFTKTNPTGSIDASNFSYARTSETGPTGSNPSAITGGIQPGTSGPLSGAGQTLFSVTGEIPGSVPGYTGTYTSVGTVNLTLPAGTQAGTYTATVTVTLVV